MASTIRSLTSRTHELITASYVISDVALSLAVVIENALEAGSDRIEVECPLPFSNFIVRDNGSGFENKAWSSLGKAGITTKKEPYNRGFGLFHLSKLATLCFTSRSPSSGYLRQKVLNLDGTTCNLGFQDIEVPGDDITTVVEAKDIFSNCPVRRAHIAANPALQQQITLDSLINTATTHPNVHFHFCIGNQDPIHLPATTGFMRLCQLFTQSFTPAQEWVSVAYSSSRLSLNGWINTDTSSRLGTRRDSARIVTFNRRVVDSPQIRSTIEFAWKNSLIAFKTSLKASQPRPVFYIELGGPDGLFETFQGVERSSLLLHCSDWPTILPIIDTYIKDLLSSYQQKLLGNKTTAISSPQTLEKLPVHSEGGEVVGSLADEVFSEESLEQMWSQSRNFRLEWALPRSDKIQPTRVPLTKIGDVRLLQDLRSIGQWDSKFLLTLTSSGDLLAFDQHAVHERIRFETLLHLLRSFSPEVIQSASITTPSFQEISLDHYLVLSQAEGELVKWHWKYQLSSCDTSSSRLDKPTFAIKLLSRPILCDETMELCHLLEHATELSRHFGSSVIPSCFLSAIKNRACRGAIMFGDILSLQQQSQLLNALASCKYPFACAHGRLNATTLVSKI
jgi:DNA mismatch repair ATPase MutL